MDSSHVNVRGGVRSAKAAFVPRQRTPEGDGLARPAALADGVPPSTALAGVTVIVPTRNEAGNVAPLVQRLDETLRGWRAELLFVDDSEDDTPAQVRRAAENSRLPVRLHHREQGERTGGLGGAVLAGVVRSSMPYVVVMDGDLQHPPELVPELVLVAERERADVVVASRHVDGGSSGGLANLTRVGVSEAATGLTRLMFPRRLRGVTDPMSGFFLVRRDVVDPEALRPDGFKILLEVLTRTGGLVKREVPFTFGERHAGESKASLQEGFRFVRQLARLWLARMRPRPGGAGLRPGMVGRGLGFMSVGVTGLFVNTALMWALVETPHLALGYVLAAAIATQGSSAWNFAWIDRLVYAGPKHSTFMRRGLGFMAMSNVMLLLRIPLLALLVSGIGVHYLIANVLTLLVGFLARFSAQERLTLRR
ncbi:MAG: glycosyltransferase [Nocardioidaceae bacterium]